MADFDSIPDMLKETRAWVLRIDKKPCNLSGKSGGWQYPDFWLNYQDAFNALVLNPSRFSGLGFIIARDPARGELQIIGIDLDCCRDPSTGWVSPWAQEVLKLLNSYTEISLSGTGFHVWVYGKLPQGLDSAESEGEDFSVLPEATQYFIKAVKPTAKRCNTIEIYEDGPRHFAMSGNVVPQYSGQIGQVEYRQGAIDDLLELCRKPETKGPTNAAMDLPKWAEDMAKTAAGKKLPPLNILDVIDCRGWEQSGDQLRGPHPTLGSSTGHNVVVSPEKGIWSYMHNGINSGGDAWLWLACECGAVAWEEAGAGALKNRAIVERTVAWAVTRGLVKPEEIKLNSVDQNAIQTYNQPLQDISEKALSALVLHNNPPTVFSRAGNLVRLSCRGHLVIEPMTEGSLKGLLARSSLFVETVSKFSHYVSPPHDVVQDILTLGAWHGIPEIESIIETPVVRPDGSILSVPGYDESTKFYLSPTVDISDLVIPEEPTKRHAEASANFILSELFAEFPFKDNASKTNTLALLLSVVVRPMIRGNVPITLLDKPRAGTGASLIADIISTVTTGKPASMWGMPETEDEWRKAITSALIDGSPVIVIDNVVGRLKSAALTRALTSKIWRDRQLGKSKMLDLPQNAVWIATGNNIQIGGDIARRAVWVRLDAACARPWLRTGFKHPDILGWIKDNHGNILAYLLIMARAWILAGRPLGSVKLGGFNEWAGVISGILEFAGVQDFMGNSAELYDNMDQDVQQWDIFLGEWAAIHADHPISAGQLREELASFDSVYRTLQDAMPDDAAKALEKDRRASLSLGVVLRKHLDQVYPSGRRLTQVKDTHTKASLWKVAGSLETQESQSSGHFAGSAGSCHQSTPVRACARARASEGESGTLPALPANQPLDADSQKGQLPANNVLVTVRFKTDYKTDFPRPDNPNVLVNVDVHEGDIREVLASRARAWVERGIVEILEA